jgi:hypothetical protein
MLATSVKTWACRQAFRPLCERFLCVTGIRAGLAQLVEHLICNQGVVGSSPITGTISQNRSLQSKGRLFWWWAK